MAHQMPGRTDCEDYINKSTDATELVQNARHPAYKTTLFYCFLLGIARMVKAPPLGELPAFGWLRGCAVHCRAFLFRPFCHLHGPLPALRATSPIGGGFTGEAERGDVKAPLSGELSSGARLRGKAPPWEA